MRSFSTQHGHQITRLMGGRSNVFLISNGERFLLVDTSWKHAWHGLREKLDRLETGRLVALILTHTHFDHAENAARIKERYGVKVFAHRTEVPYLSRGENVLPAGTTWLTRPLMALLGPRLSPYFKYPPLQPDIIVGEEYDLRPLGFEAAILHTPGHTSGSISVIVDREVAVVGDALFGIFPGRVFPPFGNDVPEMVRSWKKLLDTGCRIFLPSHGSPRSREVLYRGFEKMV